MIGCRLSAAYLTSEMQAPTSLAHWSLECFVCIFVWPELHETVFVLLHLLCHAYFLLEHVLPHTCAASCEPGRGECFIPTSPTGLALVVYLHPVGLAVMLEQASNQWNTACQESGRGCSRQPNNTLTLRLILTIQSQEF